MMKDAVTVEDGTVIQHLRRFFRLLYLGFIAWNVGWTVIFLIVSDPCLSWFLVLSITIVIRIIRWEVVNELSDRTSVCRYTIAFYRNKPKKNWQWKKKLIPLQTLSWKQSFYLKELIPIEDEAIAWDRSSLFYVLNLCTLFGSV